MSEQKSIHQILDETVRRERGWLISSLVSRLGLAYVDLAEDVAQDAILKALSSWPYKGIPDSPRAWLRRVAGNIAIDRIRRSSRLTNIDPDWELSETDEAVVTPTLSDPELDLMVLCCDPALSQQDQLILALKTVCGFTANETAALLFLKQDALSQRLARAKKHLRAQAGDIARYPTRFALKDRFPLLLKVIYLMFAWGNLPRRGETLVREDLCKEAIRLSEGLMAQSPSTPPGHHALHSLLLFQMARLPARSAQDGSLVTLDQQDRSLWKQDHIADGIAQLAASQSSPDLTRYHLEAGIASLHAQAQSWEETNWTAIARFYELLAERFASPATLINWAVSLIMLRDLEKAETLLDRASKLRGVDSFPGYHLACAKLADAKGDISGSKLALQRASLCQVSEPVGEHIQHLLAQH